jgi:FSR family fosmidomycin resistance protein-like MFS transporter
MNAERLEGRPMAESVWSGRLLGMSWAHLLNDGSANYLPGILPALLVGLNEPVAMAGTFMAALILLQSLQPFSGLLADRLGGKGLILVGLALSACGGALLGFAHDLWTVVALLALVGVGNTLFHPQALAAVRALGGTGTGARMSVFLVGGEFGRGVWPSFASLLVVGHGLTALWVTAVPALLTLPLLARWAPSMPKRERTSPRIQWHGKIRPASALVGFASMRSLSTYGVVTFVPILWHQHGGGLVAGASIITTLLVVGILGNIAGGQIADRFGLRVPMIVTSIAAAGLIIALPSASGVWLWAAAGALGIALFSTLPMTVLIGQNIFVENRALGSGIALGLSNAVGSSALFGLSLLAAHWDIATLLHVLSAASLVAALMAIALPHERLAH